MITSKVSGISMVSNIHEGPFHSLHCLFPALHCFRADVLCVSRHLLPTVISRLYREIDSEYLSSKELKTLARTLKADARKAKHVQSITVGARCEEGAGLEKTCDQPTWVRILRYCAPIKLQLYVRDISPSFLEAINISRLRHLQTCCHGSSSEMRIAYSKLFTRVCPQLDTLLVGGSAINGLGATPQEVNFGLKYLTISSNCEEILLEDADEDDEGFQFVYTMYSNLFFRHERTLEYLDITSLQDYSILAVNFALYKLGTFQQLKTLVFSVDGDSTIWFDQLIDIRFIKSLKRLIIQSSGPGALLVECINAFKFVLEGPFSAKDCQMKLQELDLTDLCYTQYMVEDDSGESKLALEALQKVCQAKKVTLVV